MGAGRGGRRGRGLGACAPPLRAAKNPRCGREVQTCRLMSPHNMLLVPLPLRTDRSAQKSVDLTGCAELSTAAVPFVLLVNACSNGACCRHSGAGGASTWPGRLPHPYLILCGGHVLCDRGCADDLRGWCCTAHRRPAPATRRKRGPRARQRPAPQPSTRHAPRGVRPLVLHVSPVPKGQAIADRPPLNTRSHDQGCLTIQKADSDVHRN